MRAELERDAWSLMGAAVLQFNDGKREVAEHLGMSFGRVRVLRRVAARGPLPMHALVAALNSDAPNVTVMVDELESRGLVVRTPNPEDRRSKLVGVTAAGRRAARKAEKILATPPAGFARLTVAELGELRRMLGVVLGPDALAALDG